MRTQFSSTAVQFALFSLISLLLTTYWIALPGPFLLDDLSNLPAAKPASWSLSALTKASLSNESGPLGRPVSALSFGLNYLLIGDNTIGFKVVNLAIHAANACLIFLFIDTVARQTNTSNSNACLKPHHLALTVAFLWALHPLHVSTVMYVVQRMTLLSTFFVLASMQCYVKCRLYFCYEKKLKWGLIAASLAFGTLAVYSKENGAALVLYIGLVECLVLNQKANNISLYKKHRIRFFGFFFAVFLLFLYPVFTIFKRLIAGYEFRDFSIKERLLTQPGIVVDYASQTLVPRIDQMGLYFDDMHIVREPDASAALSLLVIILLAIACVQFSKRAPLFSLGVGLFLASHLIESTFLPLELKFEHRNYFGSMGIIMAVVSIVAAIPYFLNNRSLKYSLLGALTMFLTVQTHFRSQIWKDELTFNSHEVQRAPTSKRARSAYAISLSRAGKTDNALEQVQVSISQHPDDTYSSVQFFQICALASSDCQEALNGAFQALGNGRISKETVSILGELAVNNQNGLIHGLSKEQQAELISLAATNQSINLPNNIKARLQLILSEAFLEIHEYKKAVEAILSAAELDPENLVILTRAAEITAGVGSIDSSIQILNLIAVLTPKNTLSSERILAVKSHLHQRRETN